MQRGILQVTRLHVDVVHCSATTNMYIGNEIVRLHELTYLMNIALLYTVPNGNQVVWVADASQFHRSNPLGIFMGSHVSIVWVQMHKFLDKIYAFRLQG